jgi:hypothetical protein
MKNEVKHERFKRVASKRTNDILEKIRILGNCSDRRNYEYSDDEISKIFSGIEKQLKVIKVKFRLGKKERFTL